MLILLDRLALNINFNTTYFLKNIGGRLFCLSSSCIGTNELYIGLRVRQVYPNSGDIMAIQYENNYITLPQEIFKKPGKAQIKSTHILSNYNLSLSAAVFVGSFYFRNISHLLQGAA